VPIRTRVQVLVRHALHQEGSEVKATHFGTCQLCGRQQKLPGGRLSNHGYTVEWSMFQGICPGSHGLPFEQSIDLIERAITTAENNAHDLRMQADATEQLTETFWMAEWEPAKFAGRHTIPGRYVWRIYLAEHMSDDGVFYTDGAGKRKRHALYGPHGKTDTIVAANAKRAEAYRKDAEAHTRYAEWQKARIANWKPSTLKEV
jgi:hypothetical protein